MVLGSSPVAVTYAIDSWKKKKNRGGICHAIHWYPQPNKKYMKDYDKNKESSYPKYLNVNNFECK